MHTRIDFGVGEGARSIVEQARMVEEELSKTHNSRHLLRLPAVRVPDESTYRLWSHAVDLIAYRKGRPTWHWGAYGHISKHMFDAAEALKVDLVWGGHWVDPSDGPHFELSWASYPVLDEA